MSNQTTHQGSLPPSSAQVQSGDIIFNICGIFIVSTIGLCGNVFILLVMRKSKELQTPCFLLIAGECLCSALLACGFLENSIEEALQFNRLIADDRLRFLCYLTKSMSMSFGVTCSCLITALISLDRLISILYPLRYRNWGTRRYACISLTVCYVMAFMVVLIGLVPDGTPGYGLMDTISCTFLFEAFTPTYLKFYGLNNLFFAVLCVILYACMLATFEWRRRQIEAAAASSTNANGKTFMKQQMACMPTVKLMTGFYVLTAALPEFSLTIMSSSVSFQPYLARFFYYSSVIRVLATWSQIVGLALGSRQFRQCARNSLGFGSGGGGGGNRGGEKRNSSQTSDVHVEFRTSSDPFVQRTSV